MLKARLREFVNVCKDLIFNIEESFMDNQELIVNSNNSQNVQSVKSVEDKSLKSLKSLKRRWPLSWVPPVHLRHPDWDYGAAETSNEIKM